MKSGSGALPLTLSQNLLGKGAGMVSSADAERNNKIVRSESLLEAASDAETLRKAQTYGSDAIVTEPLRLGSDVEIARRVAAKLRNITKGNVVFCEGDYYGYNGKCWEPLPVHGMRLFVHAFDGTPVHLRQPLKLNSGKIDGVLKETRALLTNLNWFDTPRRGINCDNGFVEFDADGEPHLIPHDPSHRRRHVLQAEWNGPLSMEGSDLERLLTGCFKGDDDAEDKRKLVGEVGAAAAMGHATRLASPKAVVLYGETAENGKSQIIETYRGLLPRDSVSAVPPTKFGDDRYRIRLAGKLLNTSDELGGVGAISGDMFKYLVTGEQVSARDVYLSVADFRSTAQHVFATNTLPAVQGGMDRGVLRRLMVLEFNRTIPEEERGEGHIAERILRNEMPLVLAWIVESATRLLRQGKFTQPESSQAALEQWSQSADPVLGWMAERLAPCVPSSKLESREAYIDFKNWAIANGHKNLPTHKTFSTRVNATKKYRKWKSGVHRGWEGIRLSDTIVDCNE